VIDLGLDGYVNGAIDANVAPDLAIARAANELAAGIDTLNNLTLASFVTTLTMEQSGDLSATQAKTVLLEILANGGDPKEIAASKGFERLASGAVGDIVAALIEANPDEWSRYREGDEKLAQFFIGQVMARTKGQANGKEVIAELQSRR
jgi:aspartyl-tRNA(Asn)/glutamyl-tRNA(Gln) amidotransferase subunit B